ncbi:Helicase associated domain protein [Streptomyces sp. H39-S7]|nr:DEAD/DEAH box helicase [Streptomyces sp. H39-S7]MCZ4120251.1 Helicase associated domain protein [Streptomyces sp. H39-S7]
MPGPGSTALRSGGDPSGISGSDRQGGGSCIGSRIITRCVLGAARQILRNRVAATPPALRPHQIAAVHAAVAAFEAGERRATVVSACGTGKTRTAAETAQRLAANGAVLVAVPTLDLLTQTIQRWRQAGRRGPALGISSLQQHRSGLTRDEAVMSNEPAHVAEISRSSAGPFTVFVTYASLRVIRQAHHQHDLPAWDLIVIDEAHRTCMKLGQGWGTIHDDTALPAKLRLYLTATPRIWNTPAALSTFADLAEAAPTATMDRLDIYGPTVYRLGLADAIERGILADYRVVMPIVRDHDLRSILTAKPADSAHHNGLRAAALQVAVLRAISEHDLRRVLVFHNRVAAANAFAASLPATAAQAVGDLHIPDLWSNCVYGAQPATQRRRLMAAFGGAGPQAVLSNVRVLNEGVDIPTIDAVVFAAARKSVIDAIQAIGRALRQAPGAGKKATLVVPVFLPDGATAHQALQQSQFSGLWSILQALRAHDDTYLDRVAMPHSSGPSGRPARSTYYNAPERALEIALALGLEVTLPPTGAWDEALPAATAYHHTLGHLDVPADYRDTEGFALGEWVSNQRLRHIAGRLEDSHRTALDALGMLWTTPQGDFARMLVHARAYAARHGHLGAAQHEEIGGHRIGIWLGECRRKARAGQLDAAHDEILRSIDPWWDPPFPVTWRRTYATATAYVAVHGTGHVPNAYKTSDGTPLGQWLNRQRNHFHTLHPAQAQLLLSIHIGPNAESLYRGEVGTDRRDEFRTYFCAAANYLAREGNLNVPRRHHEPSWGEQLINLGAWIHKVRKAPEKLTDEERRALEGLYMVWDPKLSRTGSSSGRPPAHPEPGQDSPRR